MNDTKKFQYSPKLNSSQRIHIDPTNLEHNVC